MNKTKKVIIFLIILSFLALPVISMADNIDSTYKYSWGENIGWMNWKPSYAGTDYGVTVYNECLTGYIWAENAGWIKLGDTSCAGGDCCQTGTTKGYENDSNSADNDGDGVADDWGVNNDGSGNLSGYAWGENVGWLNFDDTSANNYNQVVINSSGEFTNYAWGENIGWINMNCSNTNYCGTVDFKVKTTWTANTAPTAPTSLLCEGATNPTNVTDLTPEFSAIYNDPDAGDIANKYRVEVNTASNFNGTVMWNSGDAGTSMDNCTQGNRCQDISYAGTALSLNGATYYWRIRFWDVGGLEGAVSTESAYFTMATPVVSVSISDGTVSYGIMPVNTSKSTLAGELNNMQTATNDGNVTENFNIKGQNSANWTLGDVTGNETYKQEFSINGGTSWTALTTSYQTLATAIAVNGNQTFDLRITTPTSTDYFTQQSVNVTIQAVQTP